jgi:hypothetical protein
VIFEYLERYPNSSDKCNLEDQLSIPGVPSIVQGSLPKRLVQLYQPKLSSFTQGTMHSGIPDNGSGDQDKEKLYQVPVVAEAPVSLYKLHLLSTPHHFSLFPSIPAPRLRMVGSIIMWLDFAVQRLFFHNDRLNHYMV